MLRLINWILSFYNMKAVSYKELETYSQEPIIKEVIKEVIRDVPSKEREFTIDDALDLADKNGVGICVTPVMERDVLKSYPESMIEKVVLYKEGGVKYNVGFKARNISLGYWDKKHVNKDHVKSYIKSKIKAFIETVN